MPSRVLREIEPHLSLDYCGGHAWKLEWQLKSAADRKPGVIGFWNGRHALEYPVLLRPRSKTAPAIEDWIASAYCGWLGGCRTFLQEHDGLMADLHAAVDVTDPQVRQHGPLHVLASGGGNLPASLVQRYESLCRKWRLERLLGPYLPVPAKLIYQVLAEPDDRPGPLPAGLLLHTPDIYGPLSAKHLAQIQQSLAGQQQPPHLRQWHRILRPSNRNRDKQLKSYIKAFALRHVWNTLWHRYGRAVDGHKGFLQQVLAAELRMKPVTVRWCLRHSSD